MPHELSASFRPETVDEEARTVEVTWTTGADVLRRDFDGRFYERLKVDDDSVDLGRLQSGAPLLDSHASLSGVRSTLGVVDRAWIESGEGRALIRFSRRDEVTPVFRDVADGIVRKVSVGYAKHAEQKVGEKDGIAIREVTRWEPHELSLVPIPADNGAEVRAAPKEELPMEVETDVLQEERSRALAITEVTTRAGVPELATGYISDGKSVDQVRAAILDVLVERDSREIETTHVEVQDSTERDTQFRNAVTEGLVCRATGNTPEGDSKSFAGMPMLRVAEEVLRQRGDSIGFSSPFELAKRAMVTADFTAIMADVAGRSLRDGYESTPQTFREPFRRTTAANFKNIERVQLSDAPDLEPVAENAPYTEGTFSDFKETYAVTKFGRLVGVTWESIINDDLDAITRFPQRLGAAAAIRESDLVWGVITANGPMADGNFVFGQGHSNEGGGAFGVDVLKAARTAMRNQLTPVGRPMNLFPTYLFVGPELENEAELILQENVLLTRGDILPRRLRGLNLIVEPRIEGTNWYLATDTRQVDTLEYAYLTGEEGVRLESEQSFNVDAITWKARLVFGAGIIDYRGLYHGTGVA